MNSLLQKFIVLIIISITFTCFELLMIKLATIEKEDLEKYKDENGLIPISGILKRYTEEEYYAKYFSAANLMTYVINIVLAILTIKVLFFEKNEEIYSSNVFAIVIVIVFVTLIIFLIYLLNLFMTIKKVGIRSFLNNNKDGNLKCKIVGKYLEFAKRVSDIDDASIGDHVLWTQFVINKIIFIIFILTVFAIRIVIYEKCMI